jgi:hypothetical protein
MKNSLLYIALLLALSVMGCRLDEAPDPDATPAYVARYLGDFNFHKDVTVHRVTVPDTTYRYDYTVAISVYRKDTIEFLSSLGYLSRCRLLESGSFAYYGLSYGDQASGGFIGLDSIAVHAQARLGQSGYSESHAHGRRVH